MDHTSWHCTEKTRCGDCKRHGWLRTGPQSSLVRAWVVTTETGPAVNLVMLTVNFQ